MMTRFADTNIFIYAVSREASEHRKSVIARDILAAQDISLSTQVLQEFYTTAVKPHKLGLSHLEAETYISAWKLFPVQPITIGIVEDALNICDRYQLNYWDASIIAAARLQASTVLLSEDLNHGQIYDGVTVVNPFLVH